MGKFEYNLSVLQIRRALQLSEIPFGMDETLSGVWIPYSILSSVDPGGNELADLITEAGVGEGEFVVEKEREQAGVLDHARFDSFEDEGTPWLPGVNKGFARAAHR